MSNEKCTLEQLLDKYEEIVIPDIQRDYVMGSGKEKLKSLFKSMIDAIDAKEAFNFSCIMGYEEGKKFYVYDGQQRLTTLVYLCAYLYDGQDATLKKSLGKFKFSCRDKANEFLSSLLLDKSVKPQIVDFTTFSLDNLLTTFKSTNYAGKCSFDFLFKKVIFELVLVKELGDAEQFFIDLNDGLDLKDYEIFKAELFHKAKSELPGDFKKFALSVDNKWLKFFLPYKTKDYCEEEIEMAFIQFCFRMMWIEENQTDDGYSKNNLEWIGARHLTRLSSIMDNVTGHVFDGENKNCINYTFGKRDRKVKIVERELTKKERDKERDKKEINKVEGVHWNLTDNNYKAMLKIFIESICAKDNENSVNKDAVMWAYISNCEKDSSVLEPYLRFIKKLLNHNRIENTNAYYQRDKTGETMWYTKYSAYGLPKYYTGFETFPNYLHFGKDEYIYSVICLNQSYDKNLDLSVFETDNSELNLRLENEKKKQCSSQKEDIEKIENLSYINGLVDNLFNEPGRDDYEAFITYELLKSKAELQEQDNSYTHKSIQESLGEIYSACSSIEGAFDSLLIKNIIISWTPYTNNLCSDSGSLLPQTLTDFFTGDGKKQVIHDFIFNKSTKSSEVDDKKLYLKGYKYFTEKGWIIGHNQINYPDKFYAENYISGNLTELGLSSFKGSYNPIRKNVLDWFNEMLDELKVNEEQKINFSDPDYLRYKYFEGHIIYKISKYSDILTKKINEYNELMFYCKEQWCYRVIVDEGECQEYLKNESEELYGGIWRFLGKLFFVVG